MKLKTVDRALAFLQILGEDERPMSVKDVAAELDIKLTSAYHLVNTLAARQFVVVRGGVVSIGPAVSEIAASYRRRHALPRDVEPLLDQAQSDTGETTYLGAWIGTSLVLQAVRESHHSVRVGGLYVGYSGNEHSRASGRAVLAFLKPNELEIYLNQMSSSEREKVEQLQLDDALDEVRELGYAIEQGVFSPGAACVAAPYWDELGQVRGAVAISAPIDRFQQKVDQLTHTVLDVASEVTAILGGTTILLNNDGDTVGRSSNQTVGLRTVVLPDGSSS